MRCLTLAQVLRAHDVRCVFVSRDHPGNLNNLVEECGFDLYQLPLDSSWPTPSPNNYATWLGASCARDAEQSLTAIKRQPCDVLVVDHYSLDAEWEMKLKDACQSIFVIDDLANRQHLCDILLDQNLGRQADDYQPLVESGTRLLLGPDYALLRPDFAQLRGESLADRQDGKLRKMLISMGGVDQANTTSQVVDCLVDSRLPAGCQIIVVMGGNAPWQREVKAKANASGLPIEVHVGVNNMAKIMCQCDLSIGASGSTAWERCCLGLPSLMVVQASNQQGIADALDAAGAAKNLGSANDPGFARKLLDSVEQLVRFPGQLKRMSEQARHITDGLGASRVADLILGRP